MRIQIRRSRDRGRRPVRRTSPTRRIAVRRAGSGARGVSGGSNERLGRRAPSSRRSRAPPSSSSSGGRANPNRDSAFPRSRSSACTTHNVHTTYRRPVSGVWNEERQRRERRRHRGARHLRREQRRSEVERPRGQSESRFRDTASEARTGKGRVRAPCTHRACW